VVTADTAALIAAYLRGEREAVVEIDGWLARAASPFRRRLGGDWEDALQEVRLEVFRLLERGRFRGDSSLRSYLWQVTAHTCIDELRRRRRQPTALSEDLDVGAPLPARDPSPLDTIVAREAEHERLAVLESMSAECREVWGLVLGGLSYKAISERLGVSEGALRVRAHRCRKRATEAAGGNAGAERVAQ
jgi:RNA polymerase sigma-70 factor (ECF subfamily)